MIALYARPRCGEAGVGLKVVDDLGICALATKCCSEPLSDYQMFSYTDNEPTKMAVGDPGLGR